MKEYKVEIGKVEYFTEVEFERISDEERARRRKKFLISDIMDIINEKDSLSEEEIKKRVENALMIFFC